MPEQLFGDENAKKIIELLGGVFLFQGLSEEQLSVIAGYFSTLKVDKHTVLFHQGTRRKGFFVIVEGSVRTSRKIGKKKSGNNQLNKNERILNNFLPGGYFGEESFEGHTYHTTARVIEPSILLHLEPARMRQMITDFPAIAETIKASAETRHLFITHSFEWLPPEEIIYFIGRKHGFFLARALLLPVLLGLSAIPVTVFGVVEWLNTLAPWLGLFLGFIIFLIAIGWGIWNWIDWGNDLYIVTNRRLVWLEKVIFLYDSRTESTLDQIRETKVYASFWGRIFKYGDVTANTYVGQIIMPRANHPKLLEKAILDYKQRYIRTSKVDEREEFSQAIQKAFQARFNPSQAPSPAGTLFPRAGIPRAVGHRPRQVTQPPPETLKHRLDQWLQRFASFKTSLKYRYEIDGVITYRKHWLVLLKKTFVPTVLFMATILGMVAVATLNLPGLICLPVILFNLVFLGISVYQFLDWNNDIYRLTARQILDIERKPLREEIRKTANLEDIQSIEHDRKNIIEILLNYGKVTVNVAAGNPFNFYSVPHPDQVHLDISNAQETLKHARRVEEEERERQRTVERLMAFLDATEKLEKEKKSPGNGNQG